MFRLLFGALVCVLRVAGCAGEEEMLLVGDMLCQPECTCLGQLMNCSSVGMTAFPTQIPRAIRTVDLSHNSIGALSSPTLKRGKRNWSLKHLDLSDNIISAVIFKTCRHVTTLEPSNLNENTLRYILMTTRENIKLHFKRSRKISQSTGLCSLNVLLIKKNKLTFIPKGLWRLNSLNILDLSYNEISRIGLEDFQNCTQLASINLQDNKIDTVHPDAFMDLKTLQVLNLANNALKTIAPVALAVLHLPRLEVELSSRHWECAFRFCAFRSILGLLPVHFRIRWDPACGDTFGTPIVPLSASASERICEIMLPDVTTFEEVTVLEGENVIQICGLIGLHGSEVILCWTQQCRISEDKQDGHVNLDDINISVIHAIDTSKEGLHMCVTDIKNETIYHTRLKKNISSSLARKQRDVRSTERQVTTEEDFILAVCLSVIITFICAFCLGFFLRPWIQILCNNIKRNKGAEPAQTYQNQGFSDESFEAEIFETIVSHSLRQRLDDKDTSGSLQSSAECPQRHVSVHFDDDISNSLKETHFSGRHLYKEGNHEMIQHKDPSGSEIYTEVDADLPDNPQELQCGCDTNNREPPEYANEPFKAHAESVWPPCIHGASQLDQLSVQGLEAIMEDRSIPKRHPGQLLEHNGSAVGTKFSKQHKPNKYAGDSDSDEGRQHKLQIGPESCVNCVPRQNSICCQHLDVPIEARRIHNIHDDDSSQEWDYSSSDCEIGNVITDSRRRDNISAVNIISETEQQTLDDVVSFQSGEPPSSSHGDYDAASRGEKDEISGVVPVTLQSAKCICVFLKHPHFFPRTDLGCGEQDRFGESGCEDQLAVPFGYSPIIDKPIPTICVKSHSENISGNKVNVESYSTGTFQNLDPGCESFCFGDSSSDISYDSGTDEGSSFRFSPSSSFSGSELSRYEIGCCRPGSKRSFIDLTLDGIDSLPRGSGNSFSTLSPAPQCSAYMLTTERNIDAKESRASSKTAGLSKSTADNSEASEVDIPAAKCDTLIASTSAHAVSYEKQPNLIHSPQNKYNLSIPVQFSKEAVVSIESQCVKENLEQICDAELSTQMFNLDMCDGPQVTPLGKGNLHQYQRSCQNTHMEPLPEIYSDPPSQTTEDVIWTPRPVDFGSNWAGYTLTESMWQSNGADEEQQVPAGQDVTVIPEPSEQAQVLTTSQTNSLEKQDSEECLVCGFPEEIFDSQVSQNQLCICARELQKSTNGRGMDICSNVSYHNAEDNLPSLSIHSKSSLPCHTGVLAKTTELFISERTTINEGAEAAMFEEWKSLPGSVLNTQHSLEHEETITHENSQQGYTNETRSGVLVKNRSVFDAFVSSLQSGNKKMLDK
ncbi:leucine-rich repeat-containing protein 66 [Lissotriton helveticus]